MNSDGLGAVTEVGDDCQKAQKEAIEDLAHCGLLVGDAVLPTTVPPKHAPASNKESSKRHETTVVRTVMVSSGLVKSFV